MADTDHRTQSLAPSNSGPLQTAKGRTQIADGVVAKIAGLAAREVAGVHDMGKGTARAFGQIKERFQPRGGKPSITQGVSVEVGERQAAIDIELVCEYGVSILDVTEGVRQNLINRIEGMTGLEVTEVNIFVDDIWLGSEDDRQDSEQQPRVA